MRLASSIHRRALTLLETLMALFIFSLVIVSVTEAITLQLRAERIAEDQTRAVMLAQNVLEEIRYEGIFIEEEQSGEFSGSSEGFAWKTTTEAMDTDYLYKVTVEIAWGENESRKYVVESYFAER